MPYSIALHTQVSDHFREASNNAAAAIEIVERKGGVEIPVARLEPLELITAAEMKMLAVNIKDYLNEMPQLYRFGVEARTLLYGPRAGDEPLANGIMFRFHFRDKAVPPTTGNSTDIAILHIDPAYRAALQRRIDVGDFSDVAKQGTEPERRTSQRGREPGLQSVTTPTSSSL